MFNSLFWKLMGAFAVVILVGVGGALLLAGRMTETEFREYARQGNVGRWDQIASTLEGYYAAQGSWDGVGTVLQRGMGRGAGGGPPVRLADADGVIVLDQIGTDEGMRVSSAVLESGIPITIDGSWVGVLLPQGGEQLSEDQLAFLRRVQWTLVGSGGIALIVALVLSAVWVRGITRPLRKLTKASKAIAAGELETRVPTRSADEIGQLAGAFNQMAADLERAESARLRQAADIAHELRTPLTVIQGQLEALVDGVFPADEEHIEPALEQAHLLSRLVEDLRTLSLADAGRLSLVMSTVRLGPWLKSVVDSFRPMAVERGIELDIGIPDSSPKVEVDPQRMAQVMGNLVSNALRHTPEGGRVRVEAQRDRDDVLISVVDTGPGVPEADIPHLFERFWRVEASRSRTTGGSGLGLAIAKRIVEKHCGQIWAENVEDGGLRVTFTIPFSSG